MLTRCPKCKTLFRTSDADLRRAGGKTRCSQCYTVFLATEASVDDGEMTQHGTPVMRSQAASALMQKLANKNTKLNTTNADHRQKTSRHAQGMGNAASSIYNELVIKNRRVKYDIPDTDDADSELDLNINALNASTLDAENNNLINFDSSDFDGVNLDDQEIKKPTSSRPKPSSSKTRRNKSLDQINPKNDDNQRIHELTQAAENTGLMDQFENIIDTNTSITNSNLSQAPSRKQSSSHELHFIPDILQDDLYQEVHIPSAKKNALLISTVIFLLLASLTQYVYFMRSKLANNIALRPSIISFCNVFNCDVPYKKDVNKIKKFTYSDELFNAKTNIRIIRSRFVNIARHTQPFPIIEIVIMGSKDNKPIAFRRLTPKKYLSNKFVDIKKGLQPNTPVDLEIKYKSPLKGQTPSSQIYFK